MGLYSPNLQLLKRRIYNYVTKFVPAFWPTLTIPKNLILVWNQIKKHSHSLYTMPMTLSKSHTCRLKFFFWSLNLRTLNCVVDSNLINIAVGNEVTLPNCTNFSWTVDNIASKDIRLALLKVNLISHDLGYLQEKFGFSDVVCRVCLRPHLNT